MDNSSTLNTLALSNGVPTETRRYVEAVFKSERKLDEASRFKCLNHAVGVRNYEDSAEEIVKIARIFEKYVNNG